jgi:YegS/Rv2252/BmrU family lipid kinase
MFIIRKTLSVKKELQVQTSFLFDRIVSHRPLRAKLIFNAGAGRPGDSPQQLATILSEMQKHHILPEVYTTTPESQLDDVVRAAIKSDIKLIVVAGGDGTIDSVIGALVGTDTTLGIIPTGTRNNVALNLGIPEDIASSVALLRHGRKLKIDVGCIHSGHIRRWFLEVTALGLISDLYPMADGFQHGNLAQLGGLLSTFFSATPSRLDLLLDGHKRLETTAHMMLVANMSFLGPNFQISPKVSFKDHRLDVFTFSDMSKLNLISYVMQAMTGLVKNPAIKHYRVKELKILSTPKMPVLADGVVLGQGSATITVCPHALKVMAGTHPAGYPRRSQVIENQVLSMSNG